MLPAARGRHVHAYICASCIQRVNGDLYTHQWLALCVVLPNRCDFAVRFGSENPTSVFHLLQQACLEMIKISNRIHMKGSGPHRTHVHQGFVYSRFMWGKFVFVVGHEQMY